MYELLPGAIPSTFTAADSSRPHAMPGPSSNSQPERRSDYGGMPELVHVSEDEDEGQPASVGRSLGVIGAQLEPEPAEEEGGEDEWETDDDDGFADPPPERRVDEARRGARTDSSADDRGSTDSASAAGREVLFGDDSVFQSGNPLVSAAGLALRSVGFVVRSVGWIVGAILGPRR